MGAGWERMLANLGIDGAAGPDGVPRGGGGVDGQRAPIPRGGVLDSAGSMAAGEWRAGEVERRLRVVVCSSSSWSCLVAGWGDSKGGCQYLRGEECSLLVFIPVHRARLGHFGGPGGVAVAIFGYRPPLPSFSFLSLTFDSSARNTYVKTYFLPCL